MPTNPRWLEHTERAAWDTVKTLREELERERERLARLTRLQATWPKLQERFERSAAEHGVSGADELELLAALSAKLDATARERDELRSQLEHRGGAAPLEQHRGGAEPGRESPSVRWFAQRLQRRREATGAHGRKPDPSRRERLMRALEARVEELPGLGPSALLDQAVEIGSLALDLARIARKLQSR